MSGNTIIVEYTGEERDLVAKVARIEAQNNRLVEQLKKVGATGKQSGKSVYNAYDSMEKKAKDYERQLRNLEMSMERKGTATEKDTLRQSRLKKAVELTRGELEKVNAAHKNVTASVETHEKAEAKIESRYERSTRRIGEYRNKIRELTYDMQRKGVVTQEDATRLDRLNRALSTTQERMARVDQATAGASGQLAGAVSHVGKFVAAFTGIGSVIGGIMAVVGQLKAEYQHLVDQQRQAGEKQKTLAQVQADAIYNIGDLEGGEKNLQRMISSASKEFNVPEEEIWRNVGGPLSSRGNLSAEQFEQTLRQGVRAYSISGAPINDIATGAMNIMKLSGGSATQSLGWIRQVGEQMLVSKLDEQIASVVPVASAAKQFGFTMEEGAEIASYFTQASGDVTGHQSSSGTINFMQGIMGDAIIPYYKKGNRGQKELKFRRPKNIGMAGITELQDWYAQANPEMQRELATKIQAEAKVKGAILALIKRDDKAMAMFSAAQRGIDSPTSQKSGDRWENWFQANANMPFTNINQVDRTFDTSIEENLLNNPKGLAGIVRTKLAEYVKTLPGSSDLAAKFAGAEFELDSNFGSKDVLSAAKNRVLDLKKKYGFGYEYQTGGPYDREYFEKLPDNIKEYTPAQDGGWFYPDMPETWSTGGLFFKNYQRNENYNPKQNESINELIKKLDEFISKVDAKNKEPQPVTIVGHQVPVKIVGDTSRAPNLHANREGGL